MISGISVIPADELGKMTSITYKENNNSMVDVNIEGVPFVNEDCVYYMGTVRIDDTTEMLKPVWIHHGMIDVYNLDRALTSDKNTDIGSLKGLLAARGNKQANYTDIPVRENYESENLYEKEVIKYNNTIGASVIMTVQAQFDSYSWNYHSN
jgi:flagellar hook-associated protein 1 FlgK